MKSKVTITEIAERANVSIATVSRMINHTGTVKPATQKRILKVMEELQYNTSMINAPANGQSILVFIPDFGNPFYAQIIDGIQQTARENNYEAFLVQTRDIYSSPGYYMEMLKNGNFQGVLWLCTVPPVELLGMVGKRYPMVMCCEYPEGYDTSYVSIDDVSATYKAVNYLISTGCKNIGLINCSLKYKYARQRKEGYFKALSDAGLPVNPFWDITIPYINYPLAYSSLLQLFNSSSRPDAFFACSDVFAAAAINAAQQCGLRIPEDLSIIGFDNTETSRITTPAITTISQPCFQLGQQSCAMLMEKIQAPATPSRHLLLDTEMIIRGSTRN